MSCSSLLTVADLIDGIEIGAEEKPSSPSPNQSEHSEDAEGTTTEPTVDDDEEPNSDNCATDNVFDDNNVPKYTEVQLDAVRKYGCLSAIRLL